MSRCGGGLQDYLHGGHKAAFPVCVYVQTNTRVVRSVGEEWRWRWANRIHGSYMHLLVASRGTWHDLTGSSRKARVHNRRFGRDHGPFGLHSASLPLAGKTDKSQHRIGLQCLDNLDVFCVPPRGNRFTRLHAQSQSQQCRRRVGRDFAGDAAVL